MIAKPTTTSKAATTIVKNATTCPSRFPLILANVTKAKLAAFNINSIHINTTIARFRKPSLGEAAGLPGSGVYALHNAVDVPALLPTGKAAPTSISAVLEARGDKIESKKFEMKHEQEEEK